MAEEKSRCLRPQSNENCTMYCDAKQGNSSAERVISSIEKLAVLAGHIVNCKLTEESSSSVNLQFTVLLLLLLCHVENGTRAKGKWEVYRGEMETFPYLHFLPLSLLIFTFCSFVVGWDHKEAALAKR